MLYSQVTRETKGAARGGRLVSRLRISHSTSQHGEPVTLSSFRRSQRTSSSSSSRGRSAESAPASSARSVNASTSLDNDDTVTLAVSCDAKFALRVFAERDGYTFPVLSDHWPHGDVTQRYGVFNDDLGVGYRGTFIIDKQGSFGTRSSTELVTPATLPSTRRCSRPCA